MRIGVVLFGHLRSYKDTHSSFEKFKKTLLQQGEVDIFCHTWDIEESVSAAWWKGHDPNSPPTATIDEEEIISKYNPILYKIEPSKQFDEPELGIKSLVPLAGMLSMLYSQLKSFELLKKYEQQSGQIYDVIIKSRYDVLYEIEPDFASLPGKAMKNNCIYLPSSNPYELAGAFSDIFALGPRQLMEKYFRFNKDPKEAVECYSEEGYKELIPELLMSVFLQKQQITLKEIPTIRIHILRMSGDKFQINTTQDFNDNSPICFYKETVEKCCHLLQDDRDKIEDNTNRLVHKYLGWLDKSSGKEQLDQYARFCNGKWMPLRYTNRLAKLSRQSRLFTTNVMRDFFELATTNANYGFFRKIAQATVLSFHGYGLFYFKVIRKGMRKQS